MSNAEPTVVDDLGGERFLYRENGAASVLSYRAGNNQLVLLHTEVPEALRGRGIAGRLVRAAVERAERSGETLVPWCPYARKWLADHPELAGRVAIDWSDAPATRAEAIARLATRAGGKNVESKSTAGAWVGDIETDGDA
jgi:predicted GNAT family acetyltransferase